MNQPDQMVSRNEYDMTLRLKPLLNCFGWLALKLLSKAFHCLSFRALKYNCKNVDCQKYRIPCLLDIELHVGPIFFGHPQNLFGSFNTDIVVQTLAMTSDNTKT